MLQQALVCAKYTPPRRPSVHITYSMPTLSQLHELPQEQWPFFFEACRKQLIGSAFAPCAELGIFYT